MKFNYYYNNVPDKGLCRNNLIYTSLISDDKKVFCQWYYNDTNYHGGSNEVVDPLLMDEKWKREIKHLTLMQNHFPDRIPTILDIDYTNYKIYYEIDGPDLWEQAGCKGTEYNLVLPDWDKQMLEIFQNYRSIGLYKYSLHPSSYFVVNGKLKSINYFFAYTEDDETISIENVLSHISKDRRIELFSIIEKRGITIYDKLSFSQYQHIAFDSFTNNFSPSIMNKAKEIFK